MEATIRHIKIRIKPEEIELPGFPIGGDIISTTEEEIELPDVVNTGDIINAVANAMGNFEHYDYKEKDRFEIALEDGSFFRCERLGNNFSLYVEEPDYDGGSYVWVADFMMIRSTL